MQLDLKKTKTQVHQQQQEFWQCKSQGNSGNKPTATPFYDRKIPDNKTWPKRSDTSKCYYTDRACNHDGKDCNHKVEGHKNEATQDNMIGGQNDIVADRLSQVFM